MTSTATDPSRRLAPVVRLAPAKLNLTLAVTGARSDGFHALHSVMTVLGLADRISVAVAPAGGDTLHVTGFDPGPHDANLVLRAIAEVRSALGRRADTLPLAARLEKRIPVAAGLAGGSSDAAATIHAALEAWGAELDTATCLAIAARLGSDVPFFLSHATALVEGRGDIVTPLRGLHGPAPGVLLVTPAVPVRTPDVFAAWDGGARLMGGGARMASEHLAGELGAGMTADQLMTRAGVLASANDLAPATAVVAPALVPFRRALMRVLRRPLGQSGSGPTLWTLYPSLGAAEQAAEDVRTAVIEGRLPATDDHEPFVAATTIATREGDHG